MLGPLPEEPYRAFFEFTGEGNFKAPLREEAYAFAFDAIVCSLLLTSTVCQPPSFGQIS